MAAGMFRSRNVRSGMGTLLLSKGTTLCAKNVEARRQEGQVDPANNAVYVWVKK